VCYKRYMRKWMSERMKRRKKPADTPAEDGNKKPEPLQPRFYDNEPSEAAEAAPVESRLAPEPEPATSASPQTAISAEASPSQAPAAAARPRVSRRRRGRGGRGRSRTTKAGAGTAAVSDDVAADAPETDSAAAETAPLTEQALPKQILPQEILPVTALARPSAAAAATPSQTAAATRPSKGTVVLAIGLPGSGKSSWFKRHNIHPLSSDLLRELLFDDVHEQRFQDLIFSNLRSMLKARLIARRPMNYVDATNLTPHDRHSWIKLAKDYGYDVQGVFFDVPLEVCMERHQRRGRLVPEDIMRKMANKLKPPTFEEGFSKITVVRVKQKE
jgi:predicted kinase